MSPERWNQLRSLYDLALDYEPSERLNVLSSQAGADKDLVDEVLRMIELDNGAGDFLEESPARRLRQQLTEPRSLFEPGESVAQRFNVIRLIGSGGMGEVYEAEDTDLGERIALKTLRIDRLADPKAHARLRREALLARKITHPNVCRIFDILRHQRAGEESGEEFAVLSMELLSGLTLAEHLKQNGPFTPAAAEPIIRQVLSALIAAHQVGVIHRDLKPSNIMLVEGRAVVTDFGLAITGPTSTAAPLTTLTQSGQFIGTPEYMAPEQIRNQPVTPQSDIYSLGVVIYEMLTGQRPTQGATGLEEILNRVLEAPPSPRSINPAIPRRWESIVLRCLDRDPARRFPSANVLAEALDSSWQLPRFQPSRRVLLLSATSVAAIGVGTRYWNRPLFSGAKLILAPMENRTNDRELENVGSMLEHQLVQSGRLQIPKPARMVQLRQQLGLATGTKPTSANFREMALREGASGAVFTSLVSTGSDYELHVRLEEAANTPLRPARSWSKDFTASSKRELFSRIDDAARWLRQQSGESLTEISRFDRPAEDTTTNSWEAWRLYTDSKPVAASGDLPAACSLLVEATRFDPLFAMAWRDLADYQVRQSDYQIGYKSWDYALKALDARHNTSIEALRIRATFYEDTAQPEKAEPLYRTLLGILPADYPTKLYLGSVIMRQRRFSEARAIFEAAVASHPDKQALYSNLTPIYLFEQEHAAAKLAITKLQQAGLNTFACYAALQLAIAQSSMLEAEAAAQLLAKSTDQAWRIRGPLVLASFLATQQKWKQVQLLLQDALTQAHREAAANWQDTLPIWLLFLKTKDKSFSSVELRRDWDSLGKSDRPRSLSAFLDHALVGHLLGCPFEAKLPATWPDLPDFRLARQQLDLLSSPNQQSLGALITAARRSAPYSARRAAKFAMVVCAHHKWPQILIRQVHEAGLPNYWLSDELALPSGLHL